MWCLERNIHITAQHLPGSLNTIADAESQTLRDRADWKPNPVIFHKINQLWGPLEVDLFASRQSTQCQHYFSWRPDPSAEATDAFLQTWTYMRGYANPPWNLVGKTLSQIQTQQVDVVLIAPVWKSQPWYPTLLLMLIDLDLPWLITTDNQVMFNLDPSVMLPQLAAWHTYLRKRYRGQCLSEEATDLMLKSWTAKTNKSYDSLFTKWERWCSERGSDPISDPVAEVANFLAFLFKGAISIVL